ncbi:MAG: peptidyl-prolyl cis-trans isomerase [candidate division WOR-3 bacterium]|nr:peptidyl-prolyl cis-trans isomerase [candidate division WOR-3 bacterium]MCX7757703.1 peptidyl-prolyl cis-trans isomerase [candidate division WOR-3 bacterium]MDW7987439.1 peptidyl-prolyl cis-trans isomerase [candidate division WOR-3 bacterium]
MKTKITLIFLVNFFTLILILSCSKPEPVLAKVGNRKLTKKEFQLTTQLPAGFKLTPEQISSFLEKWINTELIYQEATRRGVHKNETLNVQIKQAVKEIIVNKFLENETDKLTVSQYEIDDYFHKHKDEFLSEIKIARILVYDESLAYRLYDRLRAGADFKKLAEAYSQDRILEKGAESRYLARGFSNDPAVEEIIFNLKPNEFTEVLKTQEGYQIIKLIDKQKVKKDIALNEVSDYIHSVLLYRKQREMLDSLLGVLKLKTTVYQNPDAYFTK